MTTARRLLLDTSVFIWWVEESPKLAMAARSLIEDKGNRVFVSDASVWEIAIKTAKGKLKLNGLPSQSLALEGLDPLPVTVAHAEAVMQLDLTPRRSVRQADRRPGTRRTASACQWGRDLAPGRQCRPSLGGLTALASARRIAQAPVDG